jgi:hypothetical protein
MHVTTLSAVHNVVVIVDVSYLKKVWLLVWLTSIFDVSVMYSVIGICNDIGTLLVSSWHLLWAVYILLYIVAVPHCYPVVIIVSQTYHQYWDIPWFITWPSLAKKWTTISINSGRWSFSSAFGCDHLYSQTVMFCKIGCSLQVVRCAPKLGLEGRWLKWSIWIVFAFLGQNSCIINVHSTVY